MGGRLKPTHGGARKGAGRPALGGETITIYIAGWRKACLEQRAACAGTNWKTEILIAIDKHCNLS